MTRTQHPSRSQPRSGAGLRSPAGARRRKRRPAAATTYQRRTWLRAVALSLGVLVLLAHIFTLKPSAVWLNWLHIDWPDMLKHFTLLSLFALSYRLSWLRVSRHEVREVLTASPGFTTVAVCSGWGGLCECLQYWIPYRDFNVFELAVNLLTPLFIAVIIGLGEQVGGAWQRNRR